MTMSKSMPLIDRKTLVIKLGGSILSNLKISFFEKVQKYIKNGHQVVIVHGGGPAINAGLEKNNIAYKKVNGIRFTSKEAVEIVQHALIEEVNPFLTMQLNAHGISSIGLNGIDGSIFESEFLDQSIYGYVGKIEKVHLPMIQEYFDAGKVPVIACFGATKEGIPLNINGDTVASDIALAIQADALLLVTDTPGIKINNEVQKEVKPGIIRKWIDTKDIYGGMIPKVQAAIACLEEGIPAIHIVDQKFQGTKITKEGVLL
jgi:acetylglutamate kinase